MREQSIKTRKVEGLIPFRSISKSRLKNLTNIPTYISIYMSLNRLGLQTQNRKSKKPGGNSWLLPFHTNSESKTQLFYQLLKDPLEMLFIYVFPVYSSVTVQPYIPGVTISCVLHSRLSPGWTSTGRPLQLIFRR